MLRRLFTILSALSLVLCVATIVLWVRSYSPTPLRALGVTVSSYGEWDFELNSGLLVATESRRRTDLAAFEATATAQVLRTAEYRLEQEVAKPLPTSADDV